MKKFFVTIVVIIALAICGFSAGYASADNDIKTEDRREIAWALASEKLKEVYGNCREEAIYVTKFKEGTDHITFSALAGYANGEEVIVDYRAIDDPDHEQVICTVTVRNGNTSESYDVLWGYDQCIYKFG